VPLFVQRVSLDDDLHNYKVARVSLNSDSPTKSLLKLDLLPPNEQFYHNLVEEVRRGNQQNVDALIQSKDV
jgi:hypothetical protein